MAFKIDGTYNRVQTLKDLYKHRNYFSNNFLTQTACTSLELVQYLNFGLGIQTGIQYTITFFILQVLYSQKMCLLMI